MHSILINGQTNKVWNINIIKLYKMKRYFHYTPTVRIEEIIKSGQINLASKSVYAKKEKAVAWVSSNEEWENTASKIIFNAFGHSKHMTFEEQLEHLGCARIEVKPNGLMTWGKLKHKARMDLTMAITMEEVGIKQGASPSEWFGKLTPIYKSQWLKVEEFIDGKWVEYKSIKNKKMTLSH